ncbi:hypothetical protein KEH51_22060 [[Brevibacterium] frigoritolerans]|uniref:Uncharacterized protein n=1 Tax=Peribacillus frigoritolerans TaxID=450367 RepID=A0A941J8H4_9BACI|nr:hypothetical protein [Peribacillus frigoritolerans]
MKIKLLLLTLASCLMAACGVEKQILEDILIAEVAGYDDAGDKKIKGYGRGQRSPAWGGSRSG